MRVSTFSLRSRRATSLLASLAWISALSLAAAGCNRPVASGSVDGQEVFAAACGTCHGPEGTPPASMVAQLGVRDLRSAEFRGRVTVPLVEHQVRVGSPNKLMPAFAGALTEAQISAVAAFVATGMTAKP